jgi:hypothetical protein
MVVSVQVLGYKALGEPGRERMGMMVHILACKRKNVPRGIV